MVQTCSIECSKHLLNPVMKVCKCLLLSPCYDPKIVNRRFQDILGQLMCCRSMDGKLLNSSLNSVGNSLKEIWKLNFRHYGQMEKHSQEEAEPRRSRASKKLGRVESQKGEDQRGRKSEERSCRCARLAKAAGAEPAGQMRDKEWHAVVARSAF